MKLEKVKCVSSMFNVPKKPDAEDPQGSIRPCRSLRNVNACIRSTYFQLLTLLEHAPPLYLGALACKLPTSEVLRLLGTVCG